ncbi:dihydrokaempferol 4-reductase [Actinobacteria bacterium IMCC25003]|nr:dihydrokaempferol 4-reductase [Actinobacteria bacterium IMCC25003]
MTTVLLTGASGYIGKHITLQLLNQGYFVRASVRSSKKSSEVTNAVRPHLLDTSNLDARLTFVELDLEEDAGWDAALRGVDVLMHTASPFPIASPKDENDLIRPAVEGTLRALKAAKAAGVHRVILTSSNAAVYGCDLPANKSEYDESMWTDVNHPIGRVAYTKSKTLAERAAWDFVKTQAPEIALTTINPVLVLGAPLDDNFGSSISVVERILKGKDPMLPDLRFPIVDVRDVARMHVDSIKNETTKGERILASSETYSFVEIAKYLKSIYPKSKVKTAQAPSALIKLVSLFDGEIKAVLPLLGKPMLTSGEKAKKLFGMKFIPVEVSVRESADYLIKRGL